MSPVLLHLLDVARCSRYLRKSSPSLSFIASLSIDWLTVQLEDLFVDEKHRAKGLGKRLFGELGKLAKEKNCGRVEWRVLKVSLPGLIFQSLPVRTQHLSDLKRPYFEMPLRLILRVPIASSQPEADVTVEPTQYRLLRKVSQSRTASRVGDDACRG